MKTRYRLIRRGIRNNAFYCVDTASGKRTSLNTADKDVARQIVEARNQDIVPAKTFRNTTFNFAVKAN